MHDWDNRILELRARTVFEESISIKQAFMREGLDLLVKAAKVIALAFSRGNRLLLFGNGGSAADAQHIAAEFVNRYRMERPGLPAVAITTDSSVLTSIGNDFDFESVFSRQLKALGQKGDVAWALSTSGGSPNVLRGLGMSRQLGMYSIALLGKDGGKAGELSDLPIIVRGLDTPRIQELHILASHVICDLVETILFQEPSHGH
ncbi:MAG: D-sedoheptulose 7-phosphate isomerase [Deltaproteobacteria bacterium]|nr:D-sedoheptulose 7-phosphate isomerase [Deltaproteobacteria bacterium]